MRRAGRSPGRTDRCYGLRVSPSKRARQLATRQRQRAAAAAAAAAQRRNRRRRIIAGLIVAALLASLAAGFLLINRDDSTNVATKSTTTTEPETTSSVPAAPSAAGKPCVPVSEPLPEGAPPVPVKVGPPPTTLIAEDTKPGTGATVKITDTLTVNYIGVSCSTGKIFDSSYSRKQPATFPLNQVIKGWQEGIPGMKVGGQRLLGIPSDQAYGPAGQPPVIAPDEALWFVVEVLDAKPA